MRKEMKVSCSILLMLFLLSIAIVDFRVQSVKAGTITVPDEYPTIQIAINYAREDDAVFVRKGTYYENIVVNKTIKLVGDGWETTAIDGQRTGNVVTVIASNVLMSGFTVRNGNNGICGSATGTTYQRNLIRNNGYGVYLLDCESNNLSDNTIIDNDYGLLISPGSANITMRRNAFVDNRKNFDAGSGDNAAILSSLDYDIDTSNTIDGKPIYYLVNTHNFKIPDNAGFVAAVASSNITIEGVDLANNNYGVLLVHSSNCSIVNVNVTGNDDCGIYMLLSDNNTVTGSLVNNSAYGIKVWYSNNNTILRNVVKNCGSFGIVLHGPPCSQNEIGENILINNGIGIHLGGFCINGVIERNTLINNGMALSTDWFGNIYRENSIVKNGVGFYQFGSSGNWIFHNNFVDNKQQVLPPGTNVWDDGYPAGGNYWSNYNGTDALSGPHQNETSSDGIGDTPYEIDKENKDSYPLMKPWASSPPGTVVNTRMEPGSAAFNLRCGGGWVIAYVEFPEGYDAAGINASTVRINGTVTCDPTFLDAGVHYADGLPELALRFNRTILARFMISQNLENCNVSLTVNGQLYNLLSFNGTIGLQISNLAGDVDCDGKVTDHDVSLLALAYDSRPSDSNWNENADTNGDGVVGLSDLVTLAHHYEQHYP